MRVNMYDIETGENGCPVIVRETAKNVTGVNSVMDPHAVVDIAMRLLNLDRKVEEYLYLFAVRGSKLLGVFEVSHGSMSFSIAEPLQIFTRLLMAGANRFILLHNHPGGSKNPSNDDIAVTNKAVAFGEFFGVTCLDHIILTSDGDYFSFAEESLIEQYRNHSKNLMCTAMSQLKCQK